MHAPWSPELASGSPALSGDCRSFNRELEVTGNFLLSPVELGFVGLSFSFFSVFLEPHPRHMEVPKLGVESELQLLAYTTATATATWDPSCICDLHHSSWQRWILSPTE